MLNTIKLIIVDDHQLYRAGIKVFLSRTPNIQILGEASCAHELFQLLQRDKQPDIVLLDIILPGQTGISIARTLKESYPGIKVVMLSSETSEELIMELSEIGIDGFISKSSPREELLEAINSVMQDIPYFGKDIARILYDLYINHVGSNDHLHHNNISKKNVVFTDKELDIIRLSGEGMRTKDMASVLNVSSRTIETHRRNIFKKLNISNSVELLKYGIKNGLISL